MCFGKGVSLATYAVGLAGCARLLALGYRAEAAFYAVVVHMQLVEYFIWTSIETNDAALNARATRAGVFLNHVQVLVLWSLTRTTPNVNALVAVFTAATLAYVARGQAQSGTQVTRVTPESAPHLYWAWNETRMFRPYYALFLATLLAVAHANHPAHAAVVGVSFAMSYAVYSDRKVTGAMWCFVAALVPWALPSLYPPK